MPQGLTTGTTVAASAANLPPARRKELSTLLLAERFYAQYDAKDFNGALITLSQRRRLAPTWRWSKDMLNDPREIVLRRVLPIIAQARLPDHQLEFGQLGAGPCKI